MKFSNRTDINVHALPTQKEDHFSKQQSGLLLAMQIDDDQPQVILIIGRWRCRADATCAALPPPPCWRQVLRRGRKNLHEFLFPRLPGTKDRSAIVLSQFKTRFHLHSSKSTRLEFRFCSENHSGLDMINK